MDLLTASVRVPRLDGRGDQLAVAMVPAAVAGLSGHPVLEHLRAGRRGERPGQPHDVLVPADLLVRTDSGGEQLDDMQTAGFVWFELLMMGSYLGAASALVERVLDNERVPEAERAAAGGRRRGREAAVENVARQIPERSAGPRPARRGPSTSATPCRAPSRAWFPAVELLGGLDFIGSDDTAISPPPSTGWASTRPRAPGWLARCSATSPAHR